MRPKSIHKVTGWGGVGLGCCNLCFVGAFPTCEHRYYYGMGRKGQLYGGESSNNNTMNACIYITQYSWKLELR